MVVLKSLERWQKAEVDITNRVSIEMKDYEDQVKGGRNIGTSVR